MQSNQRMMKWNLQLYTQGQGFFCFGNGNNKFWNKRKTIINTGWFFDSFCSVSTFPNSATLVNTKSTFTSIKARPSCVWEPIISNIFIHLPSSFIFNSNNNSHLFQFVNLFICQLIFSLWNVNSFQFRTIWDHLFQSFFIKLELITVVETEIFHNFVRFWNCDGQSFYGRNGEYKVRKCFCFYHSVMQG